MKLAMEVYMVPFPEICATGTLALCPGTLVLSNYQQFFFPPENEKTKDLISKNTIKKCFSLIFHLIFKYLNKKYNAQKNNYKNYFIH